MTMRATGFVVSTLVGLVGVGMLAARGASADAPSAGAGRKLEPLTWGSAPPEPSGRLTTEAARALMAGKPDQALERANDAIAATPRSPWAHYQKGSALAALGRWAEAVSAYDQALRWFGREDDWGRSVSMWGRAEALRESGHCDE